MRQVFRRALAFAVAFALIASAGAWRQCTALQLVAAATAPAYHAPMAAGHDHHAMMHQQNAAHEPAAPADTDHGCMKCCSMCTVANAMLPATGDAKIFTVSSVVFAPAPENWTGNLVAVDPGIPKRIV
jgi:hypothetical protein